MSANEIIQPFDPSTRTTRSLLTVYGRVLDELKLRRIIRTGNNPAADYAEWLVARHLNLKLTKKSTKGYDATDDSATRYEIKCRRITPSNGSRQLSPFRGLEKKHFDQFVGVLFQNDFTVQKACIIPWNIVMQNAIHRDHVNGHILHLRDNLWSEAGVVDITFELQETQHEINEQATSAT